MTQKSFKFALAKLQLIFYFYVRHFTNTKKH
jgi:hypothetical protein